MDANLVMHFLIDLQFNNNRNWFEANKDRYLAAKAEFDGMIDEVIAELKRMDESIDISGSKDAVFRIYKDVRFSKDKTPYKQHFGAFIARGGRKSANAGYYIHLEPDKSFVGGGIYAPTAPVLNSIRTEIVENTQVFLKIVEDKTFEKTFHFLKGDQLKTSPKGFPKDFEPLEWLRLKHYAVSKSVENEFWEDPNVVKNLMKIFKIQYPLNVYLNSIISKK